MTKAFEGKVVLVTGANSGIGEAIAVAFQQAGATVFGLGRRQEGVEEACARHPGIRWLRADVTSSKEVSAAVESAVREAGRLDAVVNNAGLFQFAPLERSTDEMVRSQFEANVYGTIFVARAAPPALAPSHGTIVNISSAAGHKAVPGSGPYGATKAAVESLTRSWALELAPDGIRVNAIAPGPVDTPGFDKSGLPVAEVSVMKEALRKQLPLGRMGSAEEVARWVVAIADPSTTWVTGQVLSVDGGLSLT